MEVNYYYLILFIFLCVTIYGLSIDFPYFKIVFIFLLMDELFWKINKSNWKNWKLALLHTDSVEAVPIDKHPGSHSVLIFLLLFFWFWFDQIVIFLNFLYGRIHFNFLTVSGSDSISNWRLELSTGEIIIACFSTEEEYCGNHAHMKTEYIKHQA